jgi:hypothetical protein
MERNFIGIGKIIIDTPAEKWNVPHLHFIVSKCDNETYEAVNLEFGLVSIDKTGWDAAQGLASLACTYLISVINDGNGFKELQETVKKNPFHDLWGEFRKIEFELAETGDDLSHHYDKRINRAIQDAYVDKLKEALEQKANFVASEIHALLSMRPPLVEYKEKEEAKAA